ncbi:MAG: hypothetical protein OXC11_12555 [Rhodospirillales bacterium]|nr:hypothetical protein [Rhodospirillales bacterium]
MHRVAACADGIENHAVRRFSLTLQFNAGIRAKLLLWDRLGTVM